MNDIGFKVPVPGAWRIPAGTQLTSHVSQQACRVLLPNLALFIPDALSHEDCTRLCELFARQPRAPVSVSGHQTANQYDVGSLRATGWGPELAHQLWVKLVENLVCHLSYPVVTNEMTPSDWYAISGKRNSHRIWVETGISPVLRFMEYKSGGKHNTHYDMGYDYEASNPQDKRRTLMSVVWYLNEEPNTGGCTRFIEDNQGHLPIDQRNLDDWTREARDDEVLAKQTPQLGGALVFWHRIAHDVEKFTGNSRIIIRGDIEFTALD